MGKLTDALLLESPRSPNEIWIALRDDHAQGSGTQQDPYDGSVRPYVAIAVKSITNMAVLDFLVETDVPHGFAGGDAVTISGVDPTGNDVFYLGSFQITNVTERTFKYSNWLCQWFQAPDHATAQPAAGKTITVVRERELLDTVLRRAPAGSVIHIGPGEFSTKGVSSSNIVTYILQPGQSILGSGIDITTLKLVGAFIAEKQTWAVGNHYYSVLHDFSISSLTIDCNVAGQPEPLVACGAVALSGKNIRISRIRAINWGSHAATYIENFVIVAVGPHQNLVDRGFEGGNCVVESCIADLPSPDAAQNSTVINVGETGERISDGFTRHPLGYVIRNCYVNAQIVYGTPLPVPIANIVPAGGAIKVTTVAPHGLRSPGNVVISAVTTSGGSVEPLLNGVFAATLDAGDPDHTFSYVPGTTATPVNPSGFVGGGVPSAHHTFIKDLQPLGDEVHDRRYEITTFDPHYRTTNNLVRIGNIYYGNIQSASFTGRFAITHYDPAQPDKFQFIAPGTQKKADVGWQTGYVNQPQQAFSADGARAEGNRILHCTSGGPYHDTAGATEMEVVGNYYEDVFYGPVLNTDGTGIGTTSQPAKLSIDYAGSIGTATIIDPANSTPTALTIGHGLVAGDKVVISGAEHNGTFPVTEVPAYNQFKFDFSTGDTSGTAPYTDRGYFTIDPGPPPVDSQRRLVSLKRIQRGSRFFAQAAIFIELTTGYKHGLVVGETVRVARAGAFLSDHFAPSAIWNGIYRITAVPDDTTFEYELSADPGTDNTSSGFCPGYYGRLFQINRVLIEKNTIVLGTNTRNGIFPESRPVGIDLFGQNQFAPTRSLGRVIIRDNVVRMLRPGADPTARGFRITGSEHALIESNVIAVDEPNPIQHNGSDTINTFNNKTGAGAPIQSFSTDTPVPRTGNAIDLRRTVLDALEEALMGF